MFTNGPWHVSKSHNFVRHTQSDGTCPNICALDIFGGDPFERHANARLIAQAPTAHQLVREALEIIGHTHEGEILSVRDWIVSAKVYLEMVEGANGTR